MQVIRTSILLILFGSLLIHAHESVLEKRIVVIIPSYNNEAYCQANLRSVFAQNYSNYRIVYVNDCSTDKTCDLAKACIAEHNQWHRVTFIDNKKNCGALKNIYDVVHQCKDSDICVTLDGDDKLANINALARINQEYQNSQTWMTYGQFMYGDGIIGFCKQVPKEVIENNTYRRYEWVTSHPRTFYAWLFKKIKKDDLLIGPEFYPTSWDQAMMLPMLEMSGYHAHFIADALYVYNTSNPLNDGKVHLKSCMMTERHIRNREKYCLLEKKEKV